MDGAALAVLGSLGGVALGAVLSWLLQRDLANQQFQHQRRRDESERIITFRRDAVSSLNGALADLVALAVREIPERPFGWDEFTIDPDKWPKDWKMMREEQDQLRTTINRCALMSPYRSTVTRAGIVVQCIDDYARAEDYLQQFDNVDLDEPLSDEQKADLARRYTATRTRFDETRRELLDSAYGLRQHLEALVSRPESDPR